MKISALGCPERKTLVVLGAGATRGAQFAADATVPPPLDGDFFRTLQMSETGRTEEGRTLLSYVRDAYGPALSPGMETVFNHLSAAATFHDAARVDPGPVNRRPSRLIDQLRLVLPRLLGETIGDEDCRYHAALADALGAVDAVISLNYDCVIDAALRDYAGARFSPLRGGYGLDTESGGEDWAGRAPGATPQGSIGLFKLHGSLNWARGENPLQLRTSIYDEVAEGVIQPPLAGKSIETEPFLSIWRGARRAVRGMRRLIIVGYSMPDADGLVRTLLATDLQEVSSRRSSSLTRQSRPKRSTSSFLPAERRRSRCSLSRASTALPRCSPLSRTRRSSRHRHGEDRLSRVGPVLGHAPLSLGQPRSFLSSRQRRPPKLRSCREVTSPIPPSPPTSIRQPSDRQALVRWVRDTVALQEPDWLEWKRGYDLTRKAGRATTAKHLIGLANRDPDAAVRHRNGLGCLLLGVEPGDCPGVAEQDSADLEAWLRPFLGEKVIFDIHYISLDESRVLLFAVEPPRYGDGIHCLRRDSEDSDTGKKLNEGTIFVRKVGKTEPATAGDIDRLTERARKAGMSLALGLDVAGPVKTLDPLLVREEFRDQYLKKRRAKLLNGLPRPVKGSLLSISVPDLNENRTEEQFAADVERFVADATRRWETFVALKELEREPTALKLELVNETDDNFEDVVLEVTLPLRRARVPPEPLRRRRDVAATRGAAGVGQGDDGLGREDRGREQDLVRGRAHRPERG